MKKLTLAAVLSIFALALTLTFTGCASSGTSTTQPSLAVTTTQTEAAADAAVNAITIGIETGAIPKATYWTYIDPIVTAVQASCATMRADAAAGDTAGAQAASDAVFAAIPKLTPYLNLIAAKPAVATTQPSKGK